MGELDLQCFIQISHLFQLQQRIKIPCNFSQDQIRSNQVMFAQTLLFLSHCLADAIPWSNSVPSDFCNKRTKIVLQKIFADDTNWLVVVCIFATFFFYCLRPGRIPLPLEMWFSLDFVAPQKTITQETAVGFCLIFVVWTLWDICKINCQVFRNSIVIRGNFKTSRCEQIVCFILDYLNG